MHARGRARVDVTPPTLLCAPAQYLQAFGFSTDRSLLWGGVGFEVGAIVIIIAASVVAFSWVRHDRNIGSARDKRTATGGALSTLAGVEAAEEGGPTEPSAAPISPASPGTVSVAVAPAPSAAASSGTSAVVPGIDFQPMTVVFRDIGYTVKLPRRAGGGTKTLLHGVSGYALPGAWLRDAGS